MPAITGSLGGSYYYPVVQSPNSSYRSVDIRTTTGTLDPATGLGRLYVSASDLIYVDPDGVKNNLSNQILSSSQIVNGNMLVNGNTTLSGALNITGSSVFSGGLIVSSSLLVMGGVTTISGNLNVTNASTFTNQTSFSGAVGISGTLSLTKAAAMIVASGTDLVLSSTTGNVTVSGTFRIALSGGASPGLTFSRSGATVTLRNVDGTAVALDLGNATCTINTLAISVGPIRQAGHLVLSSSAGSMVRMSGALGLNGIALANLPANADFLSGAILWLSDMKYPVIYGSTGFVRLLTGTLV